MCESCENYSNEMCIQFFAVWNIVWGILFFISSIATIYEMHANSEKEEIYLHVFFYASCIFAAIYALSGVLILLGDWKNSAFLFKCGLILSNPFPIVSVGTVFIPIVHIIALIRLCKVARLRWQ